MSACKNNAVEHCMCDDGTNCPRQPEALRLADSAHLGYRVGWQREAASELRRLHAAYEVSGLALDQALKSIEELSAENKRLKQAIAGGINAQLLEALGWIARVNAMDYEYQAKARAAIAAAKGEK